MSYLALQLQDIKKNEDPRLSFCTPEFKEAQRTFTDAFKVGPAFLWVRLVTSWAKHSMKVVQGVAHNNPFELGVPQGATPSPKRYV